MDLNDSVMRERHNIYHQVERMLGRLAAATVFTKSTAFLTNSTAFLTNSSGTIIPRTHNHHCSLWQILLLPYAIWYNLCPAHLKKTMHRVLDDVPGMLCMIYDNIIFGESTLEHDARVRAIIRRVEVNGVTPTLRSVSLLNQA